MPLKLFAFLEQFMIDLCMIKLTQLEKTGSIVKFFISVGNSIMKIQLRNKKSITIC